MCVASNPVYLVRCLFLLHPLFLCVAYSCAVVDEKRSHHWCDTVPFSFLFLFYIVKSNSEQGCFVLFNPHSQWSLLRFSNTISMKIILFYTKNLIKVEMRVPTHVINSSKTNLLLFARSCMTFILKFKNKISNEKEIHLKIKAKYPLPAYFDLIFQI
jgi:hypothetical protein